MEGLTSLVGAWFGVRCTAASLKYLQSFLPLPTGTLTSTNDVSEFGCSGIMEIASSRVRDVYLINSFFGLAEKFPNLRRPGSIR